MPRTCELVAEAFALGRPFDEAGDVDKVHAGRNDLLRTCNPGQFIQPGFWHSDFANVRLDRAERIVGGLCGGRLRKRVEERRLADIGQAHNSTFEAHSGLLFLTV